MTNSGIYIGDDLYRIVPARKHTKMDAFYIAYIHTYIHSAQRKRWVPIIEKNLQLEIDFIFRRQEYVGLNYNDVIIKYIYSLSN